MKKPVPRIVYPDGFSMSVQAGRYLYSDPRDDDGPYLAVEVGYPSEEDEALMPYAEDAESPTNSVYPYVPIGIVEQVLREHGLDVDLQAYLATAERIDI